MGERGVHTPDSDKRKRIIGKIGFQQSGLKKKRTSPLSLGLLHPHHHSWM
jgi:hypothetical protein